MKRIRILFIILISIVLSVVVSISYIEINSVNAQSNTSTDIKQLLRDVETAKELFKTTFK